MFCLCHPSWELLDCIRIIDFGLLPVSTLQSILISCILNKFLEIKNFNIASPPNTLTCAPSRSTLVIFFSLCFDSWSIWSRGWIVFCRCSDYTSGGVHNYVRTNDPLEQRSWEHFVIYGTCLILHELSSAPCAQCIGNFFCCKITVSFSFCNCKNRNMQKAD